MWGVNLACFQSVPHHPLLAPIYRWPGLKDWEGSDTDYSIDIRHELIFWLILQLGLALQASGVLNYQALLSIPLSVAPEILPELQVRVESQIFKSLTWSILLLHIFKSLTWSFNLSFYYNVSQGVLMNKPDNSDGSRGQLTARTNTCHLLQIQSPWTWIWETGQTHSFTAFRTYKEWIPVVLRVPSASTQIFFAS
jgi:hypothetical protein